MYSSSGLKKQPVCVKDNFIYRHNYDKINNKIGGKCIVKTDSIKLNFEIHLTPIKNYSLYVDENGCFNSNTWIGNCPDVYINENKINNMNIRINHYAIQSEDYFINIKMTRGAADNIINNNIRNKSYFIAYDQNDILDDSLKIKYNY